MTIYCFKRDHPSHFIDTLEESTAEGKPAFSCFRVVQERVDPFSHSHTPAAIASGCPDAGDPSLTQGHLQTGFMFQQVIGGPESRVAGTDDHHVGLLLTF
jgi:hypothetical protein